MKIIKRGEKYPRRVACDKCSSILEYDLNDAVLSSDPHAIVRGWIICPVCNHKIYLFDI